MQKVFKGAILALGLIGFSLPLANVANAADVGVSLNLGNVAFAYQDGYWDHGHHWHHWRNKHQARDYRTQHGDQYHEWKHNRDKDRGWHN